MWTVSFVTLLIGLGIVFWGMFEGDLEYVSQSRRTVRQGSLVITLGMALVVLSAFTLGQRMPEVAGISARDLAALGAVLALVVVFRMTLHGARVATMRTAAATGSPALRKIDMVDEQLREERLEEARARAATRTHDA
jgi:hypothetical protein